MSKKMRDVWKVWDTPELGKIYRDVFMTGKLYKCVGVHSQTYCEYTMEEVKTGKQGIYQEEGWKFVKTASE